MLPETVIDHVVRYYRLLTVRSALGKDVLKHIRGNPDRAVAMFLDYLELDNETLQTGNEALNALTTGLKGRNAV